MCLTFAILCVFYVYFMCAAIGVIINDDDDDSVATGFTYGGNFDDYLRLWFVSYFIIYLLHAVTCM